MKMKDLQAQGVGFTLYHQAVQSVHPRPGLARVAFASAALVLWGPYMGWWTTQFADEKHRIVRHDMPTNTYIAHKHIKHSCCGPEYKLVTQHLKPSLRDQQVAIYNKAYNEALDKVPEWARHEIRRWRQGQTALVAEYLWYMGERGVDFLCKEDCAYQLGLFNLLKTLKKPQLIRHMLLPLRRKQILRKMFPRITAQARNVLATKLNEANQYHMLSVREKVAIKRLNWWSVEDVENEIRRMSRDRRRYVAPTIDLRQILVYGKKPRNYPFIHYWRIPVDTKFADEHEFRETIEAIAWEWPMPRDIDGQPINEATQEILRTRCIDFWFDTRYHVINNPALQQEFNNLRTYEQVVAMHDRLQAERRAMWNEDRVNNMAEMNDPTKWPEFNHVLPEGFTRLATYEAICEEGRDMHHCVAQHAYNAFCGAVQLFHIVHLDQRATLEITKLNNLWIIAQCYGVCNAHISPELREIVNTWLEQLNNS